MGGGVDEFMPRHRSGDRSVVGGDRAILDRGIGYLRRGDRYTLDRWLGPQGQGPGGGVTPPPSNDGKSILTWDNQASGNPSYLTGSGSTAPIYKEKIVNGHPVARFSSSAASIMTIFGAVGFFAADLPWTVLGVMRAVPGKSLIGFHGLTQTFAPFIGAGSPARFYAWDQAYQFWIDPNGDLPAAGDGNFHLFAVQAGPSYYMEVDGNHIAHGFTGSPNADNFTHVGYGNSDGDIAALLYYRAEISLTDLANLRAYFGNKYLISMTNPGAPVTPDTIAGLNGWFEADSITFP